MSSYCEIYFFYVLLCIVFCLFVMVFVVIEKEILFEFKGNIMDDLCVSLSLWVLSGNLCNDYNGVFCNFEGFVESIVFWNISLGGVLFLLFLGLKSLSMLVLFGNWFLGGILEGYGEFYLLWKINLSFNVLFGLIFEFIGDFFSIWFLDLFKNGFIGEMFLVLFSYCYKIKFVFFFYNNFVGLIFVFLVNCFNFEGFDFFFNNFSGVVFLWFCGILSLLYVFLSNNVLLGSV